MFSSFLKSLNIEKGLTKTKNSFWNKLKAIITGEKNVELTDEVVENIENMLIGMDIGMDTTAKILTSLKNKLAKVTSISQDSLVESLKTSISGLLLDPVDISLNTPHVVVFVGINGVGKTTSVAKIANLHKLAGKKVLIGAADTFRAAAVSQLKYWANTIQIPICESLRANASPSAVVYDCVKQAIDTGAEVVIIDTAGRLHTKINLMHELANICKTVQKLIPSGPHEVIMVIDATTGQNAFNQVEVFANATKVTSLVVTKLDGTAKGGVIIGVSDLFQLPVKYICVGEKIDDVSLFSKEAFVNQLFNS